MLVLLGLAGVLLGARRESRVRRAGGTVCGRNGVGDPYSVED